MIIYKHRGHSVHIIHYKSQLKRDYNIIKIIIQIKSLAIFFLNLIIL